MNKLKVLFFLLLLITISLSGCSLSDTNDIQSIENTSEGYDEKVPTESDTALSTEPYEAEHDDINNEYIDNTEDVTKDMDPQNDTDENTKEPTIDLYPADSEVTPEIHAQLDELKLLENSNGEAYERKRAEIISGEILSKRITLEDVKRFISQIDIDGDPLTQVVDIRSQIEEIHGFPDVVGGSGIDRFEYWLDDEGSEKIEIWLLQIRYVNTADPLKDEILFSPQE